MEKNFIRVRSTKDITISLTLTIAGGVLVALPTATSVNILGFFMIFAGIILFLMLRTGYKETETKTSTTTESTTRQNASSARVCETKSLKRSHPSHLQ